MNKKILFIVIGLLVLISAAVAYILITPNKGTVAEEMTKETSTSSEETTPPAQTNTQPGVYTDYSEEAIATTKGTKLLFFHASWCPQCRQIEASIKADGIPTGVTVFKIDYDSNQKLRERYGVTLQTTFVKIDDAGNKIASYVAYEEPQFSSVERELLR
ncbi:MAG: thioredoxin family protein [Candidatus Microsaccharimonas sp.]